MKIILIAAISVDGKIAEHPDQISLDWTSKEDTKFFVEKTKEAGVVVMGARTFATIGKPLKGRRVIVLTREVAAGRCVYGPAPACQSPQDVGGDSSPLFPPTHHPAVDRMKGNIPSEGDIVYANLAPSQLVKMLEEEGHEAIVVAGGASVYTQFLREGLVTDLYLTVEPVMFGTGVPLVSGIERINLRFISARPLGDQSVVLHFTI